MRNLLRMDLRRLFRGKSLYIMIGVLTSVVLSSVLMSDGAGGLAEMLGASGGNIFGGESGGFGGGMGYGIMYGLLGLIAMLFVCNDYSSGFAKISLRFKPIKRTTS